MANRLLAAISRVLHEPSAQTEVHFHQGASARPAVCFDPSCSRPHLDVRS